MWRRKDYASVDNPHTRAQLGAWLNDAVAGSRPTLKPSLKLVHHMIESEVEQTFKIHVQVSCSDLLDVVERLLPLLQDPALPVCAFKHG